jgi:hypothetical protein
MQIVVPTDVNVSDNLTQLLLNLTPKIPTYRYNETTQICSAAVTAENLERLMSKSVFNYRAQAQAQIHRFSALV